MAGQNDEIKRLRRIERAARRALASNRYNPSQIEAAMEDLATALGPDQEFRDDPAALAKAEPSA